MSDYQDYSQMTPEQIAYREKNQQYEKKQEPTAGLYYTIPSFVFECEELEHSEILFYALLSGLANNKGFCFASDPYFAKRMKVSDRCIRGWLKKLERLGFITKVTEKKGMHWDRKIYVNSWNSKNVYDRNHSSARSGTAVPNRTELQFRIVSEEEEYSSSSSCAGAREADASVSCLPPLESEADSKMGKIENYILHSTEQSGILISEEIVKKWASSIVKQVGEKVSAEEICKALEWASREKFWAAKIFSEKILCESFSTIFCQYKAFLNSSSEEINKMDANFILTQIKMKAYDQNLTESQRKLLKDAKKNINVFSNHLHDRKSGDSINFNCSKEEFKDKFSEMLKKLGISI